MDKINKSKSKNKKTGTRASGYNKKKKAYPQHPKSNSAREMTLLLLFSGIAPTSPVSLSSSFSTLAVPANPSSRLDYKFISLNPKLLNGLQTHTPFRVRGRGSVIVKASAEVDGTGSDAPEAENNKVEDLPLESKLQLKLEQKIRMKLAKKIRLRRKRLVRKRQLRKKGRWPPSKMKKNKNV